MDLREEVGSKWSDKEKIGKAVDLLAELKNIILQLVRSLSKYGTIATKNSNASWAKLENCALAVLKNVAAERLSDDIDEQHPYADLADLLDINRETQIAPHAVFAQYGRKMLQLAMDTYLLVEKRSEIDEFDRDKLIDLFQQQGDPREYLTSKIRAQAAVVKRYPLDNWE